MYHRRANIRAFQELLSTAINRRNDHEGGAAGSFFLEKQDRYEALNTMASHSFQLWEVERQRVVDESKLKQ